MKLPGRRQKGSPKRTFMDVVNKDIEVNRCERREQIGIDGDSHCYNQK